MMKYHIERVYCPSCRKEVRFETFDVHKNIKIRRVGISFNILGAACKYCHGEVYPTSIVTKNKEKILSVIFDRLNELAERKKRYETKNQ